MSKLLNILKLKKTWIPLVVVAIVICASILYALGVIDKEMFNMILEQVWKIG